MRDLYAPITSRVWTIGPISLYTTVGGGHKGSLPEVYWDPSIPRNLSGLPSPGWADMIVVDLPSMDAPDAVEMIGDLYTPDLAPDLLLIRVGEDPQWEDWQKLRRRGCSLGTRMDRYGSIEGWGVVQVDRSGKPLHALASRHEDRQPNPPDRAVYSWLARITVAAGPRVSCGRPRRGDPNG